MDAQLTTTPGPSPNSRSPPASGGTGRRLDVPELDPTVDPARERRSRAGIARGTGVGGGSPVIGFRALTNGRRGGDECDPTPRDQLRQPLLRRCRDPGSMEQHRRRQRPIRFRRRPSAAWSGCASVGLEFVSPLATAPGDPSPRCRWWRPRSAAAGYRRMFGVDPSGGPASDSPYGATSAPAPGHTTICGNV